MSESTSIFEETMSIISFLADIILIDSICDRTQVSIDRLRLATTTFKSIDG